MFLVKVQPCQNVNVTHLSPLSQNEKRQRVFTSDRLQITFSGKRRHTNSHSTSIESIILSLPKKSVERCFEERKSISCEVLSDTTIDTEERKTRAQNHKVSCVSLEMKRSASLPDLICGPSRHEKAINPIHVKLGSCYRLTITGKEKDIMAPSLAARRKCPPDISPLLIWSWLNAEQKNEALKNMGRKKKEKICKKALNRQLTFAKVAKLENENLELRLQLDRIKKKVEEASCSK
ncbi:uncharacterized protein LOC136031587 [Artemia franciscana]|uniref:uncharacterized protein LOC136031587 n=1 Tax=Artemia franciscana TaxID=6661 RepID=UPI0032DA782B